MTTVHIFKEPQRLIRSNSTKLIKYEIAKDGCWNCTSHSLRHGYPMINRRNRLSNMSRYIYSLTRDEDITNKVIRHTCDNTLCINPDHLISGTQADNVMDMYRRDRAPDLSGENNPSCKINWSTVNAIRFLRNEKSYSLKLLSRLLGLSVSQISSIASGRTWRIA